MKKNATALMTGMALTLLSLQGFAQAPEQPEKLKVPPKFDNPAEQLDSDTGLKVEETRYSDRLGSVSVQHGESGFRDYYDLNSSEEIYQDGSFIERGASRTWRLGGGK